MKVWYDKKARTRTFSQGYEVLVFLPNPGEPLQAKYFGSYVIESKQSDVNNTLFRHLKGKRVNNCVTSIC